MMIICWDLQIALQKPDTVYVESNWKIFQYQTGLEEVQSSNFGSPSAPMSGRLMNPGSLWATSQIEDVLRCFLGRKREECGSC